MMTIMTIITLRRNAKKYITPVNNPTYEEECGACHFPYQPELLPSGPWKKIIAGLDDHFGEEVEIDTESINAISGYFISNSAEKSSQFYILAINPQFVLLR